MEEEQEDIVTLNVGGCIFTTTKDTLTAKIYVTNAENKVQEQVHFFSALFQGKYSVIKDSQSRVFIDRDGTHFRYILNYLRASGDLAKCYFPMHDLVVIKEIEMEATFYSLTHLAAYLRGDHIQLMTPASYSFDKEHCFGDITLSNDAMTIKLNKAHIGATVRVCEPLLINTGFATDVITSAKQASRVNYFEVKIDETEKKWIIVGIVCECTKLDKLIGNDGLGYGISVATGDTYNAHNYRKFGDKCQKGDQIGVWYDAHHDSLYFFKNGKALGCAFQHVIACASKHMTVNASLQKWYFAVSLCSANDQVTVRPGVQRPAMLNTSGVLPHHTAIVEHE